VRVDITPEDELCLLLARAQLSPEARERTLELLASPLRWPLVLERAARFDILPLIYGSLQALGFPGMPDSVGGELANIFWNNANRTDLLGKELGRILRLLGDTGVPVMPLKGVALAESLYDDPALRVCSDIDVLVPTQNAIKAFHLLVSSGYKPAFTEPLLLDLMVRYGKDCLLMREDRMCLYPIELHCGLLWGGPLERELLEQVWAEADRKTLFGVPAFTLSADWEFLYLAVHAARRGWLSLKWYADLDRLCSRRMIDWEKVKQKAKSLGWEDAVRSSLSACASLFDTPVNPAFGSTAGPRRSYVPTPSDLQVPSEVFFALKLLKTRARKLRFLAIRLLVPTSADCEFLPLPSALFFLSYPMRPFRVAWRTLGWFVQAGLKKLWRMPRRFVREVTAMIPGKARQRGPNR
jgi:hypothetical protein